jgi:hypothetical protein
LHAAVLRLDWYEILGSILSFVGGGILSLDALCAVGRVYQETGHEAVQDAVREANGQYVDKDGKPAWSRLRARLWFAQNSAALAKLGFSVMTFGFLLDMLSKFGL